MLVVQGSLILSFSDVLYNSTDHITYSTDPIIIQLTLLQPNRPYYNSTDHITIQLTLSYL